MGCAKKLIAEASTAVEAKISPLKQASHHLDASQRMQAFYAFKDVSFHSSCEVV